MLSCNHLSKQIGGEVLPEGVRNPLNLTPTGCVGLVFFVLFYLFVETAFLWAPDSRPSSLSCQSIIFVHLLTPQET